MYQCRAGERPLHDLLDIDLPAEELELLTRVDALLRVVAGDDLDDALALNHRRTADRRCDPS